MKQTDQKKIALKPAKKEKTEGKKKLPGKTAANNAKQFIERLKEQNEEAKKVAEEMLTRRSKLFNEQ